MSNNTDKTITQEQIQLLQQLRKSINKVRYEAYENNDFCDLVDNFGFDLELFDAKIYDVIESKL